MNENALDDSLLVRAVRESKRNGLANNKVSKRNGNKKKRSRKSKQAKKSKKGGKGKKDRKVRKKESRKAKKKNGKKKSGRKGKSKNKGNKRKGKKSRKNNKRKTKGKKSRKNDKKRKQEKTKRKIKMDRINKRKQATRKNVPEIRASTCLNFTCVDNAVSYLKLMKDRVSNFLRQSKRVTKKTGTLGIVEHIFSPYH